MTVSTTFARGTAGVLAAAVLLTAACDNDTLVSPLVGAGCDAGPLRVGITTSALDENSCVLSLNPDTRDRSAYAGYRASLDRDKAYMLTLDPVADPRRQGRNGLDPVMLVYGRNRDGASVPVAASDDEGNGYGSELFVVPTRAETYRVLPTSYEDPIDPYNLGGYRLSFHECPVLSLRPDTGATQFDLRDSDCRRTGGLDDEDFNFEAPAYNFIRVTAAPDEVLTISFEATDFVPVWEAFGPGVDTHAYFSGFTAMGLGNAPRSFTFGAEGGQLTIAIGAIDATGPSRRVRFRLQRERE